MDQGMGMFNYSEGGGLKHYVLMCKDDVEAARLPVRKPSGEAELEAWV